MRTRKRICAAVLTAVFAAILCLTGCSYELYEGTWGAENIVFEELTLQRFSFTLTPYHGEDPRHDDLLIEGKHYLLVFTVNGEECETIGVAASQNEMQACGAAWREYELILSGKLVRDSRSEGDRFEGSLQLCRMEEGKEVSSERTDVVLTPIG